MNVALHLARKDLLRLRGALALWLILSPVPAALLAWQVVGYGQAIAAGSESLLLVAHMVVNFGGILLAAQLALEDPLHAIDASWRTRPISRGDLFRAKLLFAFATMVLAPTALLCGVWLGAGFSLVNIAGLAVAQLITFALYAGAGLLSGAISNNVSQALLWQVAGACAMILSAALLSDRLHLDDTTWLSLAAGFLGGGLVLVYLRPALRGLAGGLLITGLVAMVLHTKTTKGIRPKISAYGHRPAAAQPLVLDTKCRLGSTRHRLVGLEKIVASSAGDSDRLLIEWFQLSPDQPRSAGPHVNESWFYRLTPAETGEPPLDLRHGSSRSLSISGITFSRREYTVDASWAGGVWEPFAPAKP